MTEPLSERDTGYPITNLLVMCVPISMKIMTLIIHALKFIYFHDTWYHIWQPR